MLYFEIFLSAFIVMLVSLSGKLFMWGKFRDIVQPNIKFLITFAMGVFSTTLFLMLNKTITSEVNIVMIAILAGAGALSLEIVQRIVPDAHHHHGADKSECCHNEEIKHKINPKRILLGDAVHNVSDGIVLVPAYLIGTHVGLSVTLGIILHELVQEISEFFLLKEGGYSTSRALISNFIVSSTILIGVVFSLVMSSAKASIPYLIAFSAGSILYIVVRDLLPHTIERIKHDKNFFVHAIIFVISIFVMLASAHLGHH